jgi:putative phosphoesterase
MRAEHADCANTVFAELELGWKNFFLSHYDMLGRPMAQSGQYDIVCFGHNHFRHQERVGDTLLINPGSIQWNKESASYAIYDTDKDDVDFIILSR